MPLKKLPKKLDEHAYFQVGALIEDLHSNFKVFGENLSSVTEKVDGIAHELGMVKEDISVIKMDVKEIKAEIKSIKNEIQKLKLTLTQKAELEFLLDLEKRVLKLEGNMQNQKIL